MQDEANRGISMTAGLICTLMVLTIMGALFGIFYSNGVKMQEKESEFRQQENDSISMNMEAIAFDSSGNPSIVGYYFDC